MARTVKRKIPIVGLNGMTIIPGMIVQFDLPRDNTLAKNIEAAMRKNQPLFITTLLKVCEEVTMDSVNHIGCVCRIREITKLPGAIIKVHVEGLRRAEVLAVECEREQYIAEIRTIKVPEEFNVQNLAKAVSQGENIQGDKAQGDIAQTDNAQRDNAQRDISQAEKAQAEITGKATSVESDIDNRVELMAMVRMLRDLFAKYTRVNPKIVKSLERCFSENNNLSDLLDSIAGTMPLTPNDRLKVINALDVKERFLLISSIIEREVEVDDIKKNLSQSVKAKVEKNQRDYILREQLKVIKKELGDDGSLSDADRFGVELEKLNASEDVKEKIKKEIDRFSRLPSESSESSVQRGYIETLLEMPWDKSSKDSKSIDKAEKILNRDHYGMEKVKERVLEFLSVRALTEKGDSPIICLVGPPGTGKTSIAHSVAEALNKKYVRISLGGVRDEAEIRGHRRTYVGAMPGRIANGMRTAGVKNPLMHLDEIDKVSNDYKGDTSSALLEVLDSEQNCRFRDHYIEIPVDLSEVLFIATANDINNIPRPLLDRMEVIEVSSYTENEKFHIAKEHLIKKEYKANGIKASSLKITDDALKDIIKYYTREAGVRGLERKIGQICRKAARMILQDGRKSVKVTQSNLSDFLGIKKYHFDKANEKDEVGIVRGLAWTAVGGDTLQIEVNVMPGKGEIILTGQLGDVMKESAQTGISYIRSIAKDYGISSDYFKKNDFHIHIPQGSVPKDGPSAGITMATAVFSAITNKPVKASVAMTGEITLRGRVLPIGGLKEKLLAAKTAGIEKVLVPFKNTADVSEIDTEITDGIEIVFVQSMDEVLKNAVDRKEDIR